MAGAAVHIDVRDVAGGRIYRFQGDSALSASGHSPVEQAFAQLPVKTPATLTSGYAVLPFLAIDTPMRSTSGSAYVIRSCTGAGTDFRVFLIGENAIDLCSALSSNDAAGAATSRVASFPANGIDPKDRGGIFYQIGHDWIQLVFEQQFQMPAGAILRLVQPVGLQDRDFFNGMALNADGSTTDITDMPGGDVVDDEGRLWIRHPMLAPTLGPTTQGRLLPVANGGVIRYTATQQILLAPGTSVETPDRLCIRIGAVTDTVGMAQLVGRRSPPPTASEIAQSRMAQGCDLPPSEGASRWIIYAITVLVVGAVMLWLRRRWLGRQPRFTGMLPPES